MKILSKSKMREVIPLEPSEKGQKRVAVFTKNKETELEEADFEFLKDKFPFTYLLKEGIFIVVGSPEVKKEEKKENDLSDKIAKIQTEADVSKQKAMDSATKKKERKNATAEYLAKVDAELKKSLTSIQGAADKKIEKLKG